jgi:hypothetical protein
MQGRGRWVIHHRGAELIHGFLELHRHRLQGAQAPQLAAQRYRDLLKELGQ